MPPAADCAGWTPTRRHFPIGLPLRRNLALLLLLSLLPLLLPLIPLLPYFVCHCFLSKFDFISLFYAFVFISTLDLARLSVNTRQIWTTNP